MSAASLKLFGKINGTEKDYYIVEAVVEGEDEADADGEEKDADFEPKGTGVNKFTYFVSQDSLSEWIKLPDLSPKQI